MNLSRRMFIGAAAALCVSGARAQVYPSRPLRLIVPFPPGGNVDLSARIVAPELARELGQPVVVDNKAGAGGILGLDAVAKAAADGYTIGVASPINHLAAPALYPKLPYDSIRDFTPIGLISSVPMVLVVGPSVRAHTLVDLIALARQRSLSMASAGSGSGNHIVGELFQKAVGVRFVHVPYKGSAPANNDVAGGHVDLHFDQLSSVLPLVQSGRLRPLAITSTRRSSLLPDVPTLEEAGLGHFDFSTTLGLVAPAGVPPTVVERLSAALLAVLNRPAVKEQFIRLGAEVRPSSPAEYAAFIRREIERTAAIVREAGIKLD